MSCVAEHFVPSVVVNVTPRQPIKRDNTALPAQQTELH
jgi:hypothetical protein